jgi:hypothetical protein
MAQALPATAAAIHDLLLADTALAGALGTYRLAAGATVPAIAVLASNEQLPPGTTVEGIEVVITAVPTFGPQVLLTAETLTNPTWRIYISGWQTAAALQTVTERVMALLPGAFASVLEGDAQGQGIGVIEQRIIRWTNPTAVIRP